MAARACKDTAKRLLKCFCGCSELSEEEVQRIYRLSAQATLIDRVAVQLLHRFLEQRRSGDKSQTEQFLDVYEQCGQYLLLEDTKANPIITLDELDELCELGLPYNMEKELKQKIQTGDHSNIERCLLRIQGECRNEIEASTEYKDFKQAILDKLKFKAV